MSNEQRALKFITADDAGHFVIGEEAAALLSKIDLPIAVVAVVGEYRTGKSYLMNLLKCDLPDEHVAAAGDHVVSDGFDVGHSAQACTKGVWLWGEPVEVEGKKMAIVFLDTEGLDAPNAKYDERVFALALLLGSTFVYNSRGQINGQAIAKLSHVVHLTKYIHVRANAHGDGNPGEVQEFHDYFPNLMWVVRDFTMDLKTMGANGRSLTPQDYLNRAFEDENGVNQTVSDKNNIRRMLRTVFPKKDCMTLVLPVSGGERELHELPSTPWSDLRDEFKRGIKRLKKKLFSTIQPKMLYGKQLNGPMFLELSKSYVEAMNKPGGVPTISSAWERVVTAQCDKGMRLAMSAYENAMTQNERGERTNMPVVFDEEELMARHNEVYKNATDILRKQIETVAMTRMVKDTMEKFGTNVQTRWEKIKKKNAENSEEHCKELIEELTQDAPPGAPSASASVPLAPAAASSPLREERAPSKPANSGLIGTKLRRVQKACDHTVKAYKERARGPAKWEVLQNYLLGTVLKQMKDTAVEAAASEQTKLSETRRELKEMTNKLTEALKEVTLVKKDLLDEKTKSQDAIRNERKKCELEKEALTEKHNGKLALQTIEWNNKEKKLTEQLHKAELQIVQRQQQSAAAMVADAVDSSELKKTQEKLKAAQQDVTVLQERVELLLQQQRQNAATKTADAVDPSEFEKIKKKLEEAEFKIDAKEKVIRTQKETIKTLEELNAF